MAASLRHFRGKSGKRGLRFERLEARHLLSGSQIVLGPATDVFDQPYVDVELLNQNQTTGHGLGPYGAGGEIFGVSLYPYNHLLLDTGANSITLVSNAAQDLVGHGLQNVGTFSDIGVAGATDFNLSAPYKLNFAGTDGVAHTLSQTSNDVRILTNPNFEFGGAAEDGGVPGLIGMPAMVGRVTTLDMTGMAGGDLFSSPSIGVSFSNALPAGNGHRYTVPTNTSVTFDPRDGLPPGSPANAPVPSWAPVTFVTATVQFGNTSRVGTFLVDTGAQMSVISTALAFQLGLDTNNDGSLLDEAVDTLPVTGVGGTVNVPVMAIDKLRLATTQGPELVWQETQADGALGVIVQDIAPGIDGVLGADLLTSGMSFNLDTFAITGAPYFDKINLDFRNLATQGTGQLVFDVNPTYDHAVAAGSTTTGTWTASGIAPQATNALHVQVPAAAKVANDLPQSQSQIGNLLLQLDQLLNGGGNPVANLPTGTSYTNGNYSLSGTPVVLDPGSSGTSGVKLSGQLSADETLNVTTGQLPIGGSVDTGGHQLIVNVASGGSAVLSAPLSGTGSLKKLGSGTLTVGSHNTMSGGVVVGAGKLQLTDSHAIPAGASVSIQAGATLVFGGAAAAPVAGEAAAILPTPIASSAIATPDVTSTAAGVTNNPADRVDAAINSADALSEIPAIATTGGGPPNVSVELPVATPVAPTVSQAAIDAVLSTDVTVPTIDRQTLWALAAAQASSLLSSSNSSTSPGRAAWIAQVLTQMHQEAA